MNGPAGRPPGEVEIRPFREGDEPAIEAGFRRLFAVDRPRGEWAWKFPPADEAGGRRVMLAVAGGEVVAHAAAQPVPFVVDGRPVLAGHVVDAYSRPAGGLARRGVFARTVEELFAAFCGPGGIAFVYGFPGTRHMRLGRRLLGYAPPRPVPLRERRLGEPPGRRGGALARLRAAFAPRVVERLDRQALDDLWRRAAPRYPVAAVRDGRRAAARFAGRPGVDYLHLAVHDGERAVAWAAARLDGDLLRWADLVWDGGSPAALTRLDEALVAKAHAAGATRGELWLGGDAEAEAVLAARGWQAARHPHDLEMTAVAFVPDLDAAALVGRAYLTMGDSDLV
jgi:hypothetical protein